MSLMWLARSLFGRGGRGPRKSARYRPEVTALEGRWLPSTITEFPLPPLSFGGSQGATAITGGPDGNLWFTDPIARTVGRVTPAGQVTERETTGAQLGHRHGPVERRTISAASAFQIETELTFEASER